MPSTRQRAFARSSCRQRARTSRTSPEHTLHLPTFSGIASFVFGIFDFPFQYFDGVSPVFGKALGSLPGHVKPLAISLEDCGLLDLLSHKGFSRKLIALITKNGSELTAQYTPAWVPLKSFKMGDVIAVLRQLR